MNNTDWIYLKQIILISCKPFVQKLLMINFSSYFLIFITYCNIILHPLFTNNILISFEHPLYNWHFWSSLRLKFENLFPSISVFLICFYMFQLFPKFTLLPELLLTINIIIPSYLAAISFIILWDFLMFHQIFLSPPVKRWAIITHKHGIYELPHELSNNLRLRTRRN